MTMKNDEPSEKLKAMAERIRAIMREEFPEIDYLLAALEPESGDIGYFGTSCPVCVAEHMMNWIETEKIIHRDDERGLSKVH